MNSQCPCKWWATLNLAVFTSSSDLSLPPLIEGGGIWGVGLLYESVGKVDLLSAYFDCNGMSCQVRWLQLDLDFQWWH